MFVPDFKWHYYPMSRQIFVSPVPVEGYYYPAFFAILCSPLGVLPPLMHAVFKRSEKAVGDWLGRGFDADVAMLEAIGSGRFADTPAGRYLATLRTRFHGPIIADLLCYLRLTSELALRAKGILLMRENGFDVDIDEATRAKITEMAYLEKSIGRTGLLAIRPLVHTSHRDLWQLRWISG